MGIGRDDADADAETASGPGRPPQSFTPPVPTVQDLPMRSVASKWSRLFTVSYASSARIPVSLQALPHEGVLAFPLRRRWWLGRRTVAHRSSTTSHYRGDVEERMATGTASSSDEAKELYVLRHGQATHNPRAEAAREAGCSWDAFLELMRQDDSLDAELTELGRQQAQFVPEKYRHALSKVELVVSSPLSRALQTAEWAAPRVERRVVDENFREIHGLLLNAKRRSRSELSLKFPRWSLDELMTEHDEQWTSDVLEDKSACGERGFQGMSTIMRRDERVVLLVAHGGLLRMVMAEHPNVFVRDGRNVSSGDGHLDAEERDSGPSSQGGRRDSAAQFSNCELRRYRMEWRRNSNAGDSIDGNGSDRSDARSVEVVESARGGSRRGRRRRQLELTELDIPG